MYEFILFLQTWDIYFKWYRFLIILHVSFEPSASRLPPLLCLNHFTPTAPCSADPHQHTNLSTGKSVTHVCSRWYHIDTTLLLNSLHLNKLLTTKNSSNLNSSIHFPLLSIVLRVWWQLLDLLLLLHIQNTMTAYTFCWEWHPVYSNIPPTLQTSHNMHKPNMIASLMQ